MSNLNKRNKVQCQVILGMLVPALLLQQADKGTPQEGKPNPAVNNCIAMIDEIFASHADDQPTIDAMRRRIDVHRVRFTKRVSRYNTEDGVIGSLQMLSSGLIKSRAGTRLDYIINTFSSNLSTMKVRLKYNQENADAFEKLLKEAIIKIG